MQRQDRTTNALENQPRFYLDSHMVTKTKRSAGSGPEPRSVGPWRLRDAKAHFSEVVRKARTQGPQRVTVRGQDAVVVIDAKELDRLLAPPDPQLPFLQFLESLAIEGLDLERPKDTGRDVDL